MTDAPSWQASSCPAQRFLADNVSRGHHRSIRHSSSSNPSVSRAPCSVLRAPSPKTTPDGLSLRPFRLRPLRLRRLRFRASSHWYDARRIAHSCSPELQGLHFKPKPKPKPTASPEPASTDEDEHAQSSSGAAPQAQTEPTSPVAPLAPYPPVPPGAGTRSRAPEFYGFVAWTGTYLLFCAYLLWAFLPDALIQALGVSWYPNRCVALPSSSPPSRALTSVSSRPSSLLRLPRLCVRYARPLDARAWPDRTPRPLISVRAPWPTRRASRVSPRATDRPRTARDGLSPSRNAQCPPPSRVWLLPPPAFTSHISHFVLRPASMSLSTPIDRRMVPRAYAQGVGAARAGVRDGPCPAHVLHVLCARAHGHARLLRPANDHG